MLHPDLLEPLKSALTLNGEPHHMALSYRELNGFAANLLEGVAKELDLAEAEHALLTRAAEYRSA